MGGLLARRALADEEPSPARGGRGTDGITAIMSDGSRCRQSPVVRQCLFANGNTGAGQN